MFLLIWLTSVWSAKGQEPTLLKSLLESDTSAVVKKVLANQDKYRLQVIYTQINRDSNNIPSLQSFYYRHRPDEYFYQASMVKLPCAAFALEKVRALQIKGVDRFTLFKARSNYKCYGNTKYLRYEQAESLSQLIRRLFVISDNNAYNLLYEFLGQAYIHERFRQMGQDSARIIQKFVPCDPASCRTTGPLTFYKNGKPFYSTPKEISKEVLSVPLANTTIGRQHVEGRRLRGFGVDFKNSNFIALQGLHEFVMAINLPEAVAPEKRFKLKDSDYTFLRTSMGMYPRELSPLKYKEDKYPDTHMKYLLVGKTKERIDTNIRIFNKVGLFYGFMTDCAYIVDYKHKTEFFLSAVLYVNEDDVINDGVYEYDQLGHPFLERLGRIIYEYELKRPKAFLPELKKLSYK